MLRSLILILFLLNIFQVVPVSQFFVIHLFIKESIDLVNVISGLYLSKRIDLNIKTLQFWIYFRLCLLFGSFLAIRFIFVHVLGFYLAIQPCYGLFYSVDSFILAQNGDYVHEVWPCTCPSNRDP